MYQILMILTDGQINDTQNTSDIIVECSKYPISIIIVGVGNANFDQMEKLDGDEIPLRNSQGDKTIRDIVQFVKFNDFKGKGDLGLLAEEVLKEVPDQLVGYMMTNNIKPAPIPFNNSFLKNNI